MPLTKLNITNGVEKNYKFLERKSNTFTGI